jgi:hypothetical protein
MPTLRYRVLLATIRDKGKCPCPRCIISGEKIEELGLDSDRQTRVLHQRKNHPQLRKVIDSARKLIYVKGLGVKSAAVERGLRPLSLVPTKVRVVLCI